MAAKTKPTQGTTTTQTVAQIVSEVAQQFGIPPAVALAMGEQESGLNSTAVGDNGTSFGVFQLHEGGELGSHTQAWADNVRNNAETALREVAAVKAANPGEDWGWVTAHAQRPTDETGYAASVNSILNGYTSSGQSDPVAYFESRSRAGATLADDGDGAGSGSGGGAGGGGNGDLNSPAPQSVKTYLHDGSPDSTYGYLAAYIHDPQIGPILAKAAKEGWSQDRLFGKISQTQWWKTTSQSARTWQETQRLDPATARQQLAQEKQHIQQLAQSTLGSTFDPGRLNSMANAAIASNWSDAQLQAAIGAEFKYQGAKAAYEGAAGKTVDALQQLSSQYLVPISRSTMQQWSKQVLEGTSTTDDFQSYLQSQAESLYPTLTSALKSGQTVAQFADPYVQMASQILEKPVGDFNLMNPKWAKALNTVQPDGSRAPMALSDWGDYLRSTTDYQGTQQAQQQAAAFGQSLGNLFGKISTGSDMSGLNASTAVTTS